MSKNQFQTKEDMKMQEKELLDRAFAMPLTSPAYPRRPYRFVDREYLIITYRTDAAKLRAVVPEPLEIDEREALVHASLERLRRLHGERPGDAGLLQRLQRQLHPLHVP
jgi:Acetoacetate decarboxylase (ADC)